MRLELTPEQAEIQARARRFAREEVAPRAREADERGEFPVDLVVRMAQEGFLAGPLGPEWDGGQMDHVAFSIVYEELGWADSSVRGFLAVHTGLVTQTIAAFGTDAQRERWLPRLISGEAIGCYCLTEPHAGSDAASIETTAREEAGGWVLNGEKIWITNGNIADIAIVFATRDPSARHRGICAFLVPTDTAGFHRERMPGKELGHRASDHAHITLNNLHLPEDAILGGQGEGFHIAMAALDNGRLGVAAGAVGVAQACLDASLDFTQNRRQFGQPIGDFQMIQATLADMATAVEAARLLVRKAAWMKDEGYPSTSATSMAKLFATEIAVKAASDAVLLHGGRGYSNEYPVERHYRDIKGLQIYEGTSHIQRIVIARRLTKERDGESGPRMRW